ncbi:centrosomal protein of 126 kDa [Porphyrio hochstetteri]
MAPGVKGGGATWGQNTPGGLQACSGERRCAPADRALTFHFAWDFEEERQVLKEDQKICRNRAQKYLIETNRRMRAFEERQKQEEEKEQRLREQVLQQRKKKLQEATGKFLHTHLPFSQHKQIVQAKAAFQLEDAIEQIKGSVLTPELCLPNRNKNNFRKNLRDMEQLEKQSLSNLENVHQEVKKSDDSESLSSLDSLEVGAQSGNYTTSSESSLTVQCDCALYNPEKSLTRKNGLLYTAESTSKNMHLNNCLRNADLQNNHNSPIHDLSAKHNVLTLAEHVNNSEEESSASHRSGKKPAECSTSGKQDTSVSNAFRFLQNIHLGRKQSSRTASTLATGHPVFNPSKACASPDSIPGEKVQNLMQDQSFKMTPQKRTVSVQTSSQPIATSIILFPNQVCSTGIPSTADTLLKDKNISRDFVKNTSGKMPETKEENIKRIEDINPGLSSFHNTPNASVLHNIKQQNNKEEKKGNIVAAMSLVSDTDLSSHIPAQHRTMKNNILERKRATLFTSILKKESKYEPSQFKAVVMNHKIGFGIRPISSIRDSLDLAKLKKKSKENEKNNRKLTWCDQVNQIIIENNDECYEKNTSELSSAQLQYVQTTNNAPKTNLSIVPQTSNPMFITNHQEESHISKPNVNTAESSEECTPLNMFMLTGSFSAEKAWMVSKDEESKPPVCSNNSKINEVNQLQNKAKITRRPRSERAQPNFMPKKRAGTIIQPQLASETNKTLKAPRKFLAPHPPSTPLPGNRSGKKAASPGHQSLLPSSLHATATGRNCLKERQALLADGVLNRIGPENSQSSTCHSDLATAMPTPGCSTARRQPWAKNTSSLNSAGRSACRDRSMAGPERRPANAENGLHLCHFPATGKTSTFWQGVHTAPAPKDSAAGGVPVSRQKQVVNNHENKHRPSSEHGKQSLASKRWKSTHHTQNSLCAAQLSPVQSAFDPAQRTSSTHKSAEVSESTLRFLVAEKLAVAGAAEDEILAAMKSVQPAREPLLLNRTPCQGMSALSVEEEKIFQSIDQLNQRLENVQEAITRNPSASNVLQIINPLQSKSSPVVNPAVASQQYQNASAGNRLRLHRRY